MPHRAMNNGAHAKTQRAGLVEPAVVLAFAAMQLLQFLAACLFPGAVYFAVEVATARTSADSSELEDRASSPSLAFSAKAAAGSGSSSLSSPSSASSSDGDPGFFTPRQESPSATPRCFRAGGYAGRRLLRGRGSRARAPTNQEEEAAAPAATMAPKVKGDVVRRYLRKISRRLRKDRTGCQGSPSLVAAVDGTARERAESVARAIAYCKDTLRRGMSPPPPPPPPPSPSLDDWLHDRQEAIIASAAVHCDECRDSMTAAGTGNPLSQCDAATGELEMLRSLDEMEFLKMFDGDEEMIDRHFISVEI